MITVIPDYYKNFKCIASACMHTCCAGWEIDIDPVSLERFKKDGIDDICIDGTPHFKLLPGDRCPKLRSDGLCQLIIDRGEDYLCDICRDHPRYRNFWTGITETGIGLSCEEAARLILGREKPMNLCAADDSGNEVSAEVLADGLPEDEKWLWNVRAQVLMQAAAMEDPLQARLAEYFAFRQIPDALYDGRVSERVAFVWHSVNEITRRWNEQEDQSFEALCETARAYSEYVEYNTERLDAVLDSLR